MECQLNLGLIEFLSHTALFLEIRLKGIIGRS